MLQVRWMSCFTTPLHYQQGVGESPTPWFYRGFSLYTRTCLFRCVHMYKFCTHVHSENPKTHPMHKSFTMLKWCRSSWPTPHGDNQVVMATTRLWWHWTKWPVPLLYPRKLQMAEVGVDKMSTWSCTAEVRGRCEKINGQILSVDFLKYRDVHLPLLCTHPPVRTYIAKSPKRAIYAILYGAEVVWVRTTQTNRFQSSSHFENLISVISFFLYKKVSIL